MQLQSKASSTLPRSRCTALPQLVTQGRALVQRATPEKDVAGAPLWQGLQEKWQKLGSVVVSTTLATALCLAPPSFAEPRVVRLPASSNPEIFSAQRTMVEAWTIVGESFVDPYFNSLDWPEELRQHMIAAYTSDSSPRKAWEEINAMLSRLGDPYTRRIEPDEYQAFRVSADGELQGIGLLIANDLSNSGHLRVLAPIKGGPADRAGILPGDEVISINGEDTTGWTGDHAAKVLRGKGGTEVKVRLQRRTEGIPGVPSRPEPITNPYIKEVALKREAVQISPVYGTLLQPEEPGSVPIGYVRLSQFSGNAARDMRQTVATLQQQGAGRFILDLRSNPGGLVKAGVDIAAMFLDGEQTVFTVAAREAGGTQIQTTESTAPALAHEPLVVLVDNMSASASEIVSGALHDNNRALVMGDTNTYGKGRIQSVFELQDGSALFVTVARYQTPAGTDIDMKGIHPDRACQLPGTPMAPQQMASLSTVNAPPARNAFGAPVVRPASVKYPLPAGAGASNAPPLVDGMSQPTGFMPGIPLDPQTESLLKEALVNDRCVLAAEKYLESVHPGDAPPIVRSPPKLTPAQDLYLAIIQAHRNL